MNPSYESLSKTHQVIIHASLIIPPCIFVFSHSMSRLIILLLARRFLSPEVSIVLAHGLLALTTLRHIMNPGPRHHRRTTERVDNTSVSSSVAPSEFSTLCASRAGPRPAESFSQKDVNSNYSYARIYFQTP